LWGANHSIVQGHILAVPVMPSQTGSQRQSIEMRDIRYKPTSNHRRHQEPCADCGRLIWTSRCGGSLPVCEECHKERRRLREVSKRYHKIKNASCEEAAKQSYIIVFDPDPDYGFKIGTKFPEIESNAMLENCSYTPGTELVDMDGKRYRVIEGESKQILEEIEMNYAIPRRILVPSQIP
jgi:hypothetical protein